MANERFLFEAGRRKMAADKGGSVVHGCSQEWLLLDLLLTNSAKTNEQRPSVSNNDEWSA